MERCGAIVAPELPLSSIYLSLQLMVDGGGRSGSDGEEEEAFGADRWGPPVRLRGNHTELGVFLVKF